MLIRLRDKERVGKTHVFIGPKLHTLYSFHGVTNISIDLSNLMNIFFMVVTSYYIQAASRENRSLGFPTRYTDRAVQPREMARGLKFRIKEVEVWCQLCSCIANLCLCFRICKRWVFLCRSSKSKSLQVRALSVPPFAPFMAYLVLLSRYPEPFVGWLDY